MSIGINMLMKQINL